ncbi:LysR substrate-binding domain-containing protein [Amycolatopsis alba]|uniref:LysR substrate-binding domain-containing protein n=1 Tax=Amycolatopsis alba TaxID=76020 RepID=UPI00039A9C21|nr:LysR substrate-binding domain-containing protein [Amycolatopsis alba]
MEPASNALAVVAEGVREARNAARTDTGVLRIGLSWIEALGELQQPILSAYAEAYPETHLVFTLLDPGEQYHGLPGNVVDIALTRLPLDPEQCAWIELFADQRVVGVAVGNPVFDAPAVHVADIIDMPVPNIVLRTAAPSVLSYWMLDELRGEPGQRVGELIGSPTELAYTALHHSDLICAGPGTVRRYPPLPPSLLRFIDIVDGGTNCAVVACRRNERRPAVLRFCEMAKKVTRQLGRSLLPSGTTILGTSN